MRQSAFSRLCHPSAEVEFGAFRVVPARRLLLHLEEAIPLSSRAFDLLLLFLEHAGELLENERIMSAVWPHRVVEESNLRIQIALLRRALQRDAACEFIINVPGRGYLFTSQVRVLTRGMDADATAKVSQAGVSAVVLLGNRDLIAQLMRLLPGVQALVSPTAVVPGDFVDDLVHHDRS